jgi:hypothetical protein
MSEYQRYEFMTIDRPLTRAQLDAVNGLSSHIEASSTHALIEYHWGDFKHNPIEVLHQFFDGFLYWANWGSPQLALRFPHGALPLDLIADYDLDDFVTFIQHADYDILDIHFGELGPPDAWTAYELGSFIAIRDELMEGDLRALYIAWLATQRMLGSYDEEEDEYREESDEEEENDDEGEDDEVIGALPVPPGLSKLTEAQQALADLLQVPQELLVAAAQHSNTAMPSSEDDFVAWIELLPQARRNDYLLRLAHNESGLSRLLVKELRELGQSKTKATPPRGEYVTYATLLSESDAIKVKLQREQREQEQLARQRHLQAMRDQQDKYWQQADLAVGRGSGAGYDEDVGILVELREVANHFKELEEFQERFRAWVRPHLRRPAFIKRLQERKFLLPEA